VFLCAKIQQLLYCRKQDFLPHKYELIDHHEEICDSRENTCSYFIVISNVTKHIVVSFRGTYSRKFGMLSFERSKYFKLINW
jgi:hypothetical protein